MTRDKGVSMVYMFAREGRVSLYTNNNCMMTRDEGGVSMAYMFAREGRASMCIYCE